MIIENKENRTRTTTFWIVQLIEYSDKIDEIKLPSGIVVKTRTSKVTNIITFLDAQEEAENYIKDNNLTTMPSELKSLLENVTVFNLQEIGLKWWNHIDKIFEKDKKLEFYDIKMCKQTEIIKEDESFWYPDIEEWKSRLAIHAKFIEDNAKSIK